MLEGLDYINPSLETITVGHWDVLVTALRSYCNLVFHLVLLLTKNSALHGSLRDISSASQPEDVLRR